MAAQFDHHCSSCEVMCGGDLGDALTRVDRAEQIGLRDRRHVVHEDPDLGEPPAALPWDTDSARATALIDCCDSQSCSSRSEDCTVDRPFVCTDPRRAIWRFAGWRVVGAPRHPPVPNRGPVTRRAVQLRRLRPTATLSTARPATTSSSLALAGALTVRLAVALWFLVRYPFATASGGRGRR